MEDELPHELSTITEVDTPATSRLNATDATNLNENTIKNGLGNPTPDDEALKILYNAFPNFKDYIKSNPNVTQASMASLNETDVTVTGVSAIMNEVLVKPIETYSSQAEGLKYKAFDDESQRPANDKILDESELRMSYHKFPSHSEYAQSVPGLIDSQSLDQLQISDANDNSTSSLPDIVNELKNRKILEHSFEEAEGQDGDLDDLLMIRGKEARISTMTTEENWSDVLENDLNSMGLSWVTAELKKSRAISTSTSVSSDTSNRGDHRSSTKQMSPNKPKTAKRTYQAMNQSKAANDSFVDPNLRMTTDGGIVTSQPTDGDPNSKSLNLKDFLARELLKHSSISSSSDSSLASMFVNSYLAHSSSRLMGTPQNRALDKHRTSTPVEQSTDSKNDGSSKKGFHSSSIVKGLSNETGSPTFFSNESQISSVHFSTSNTTLCDEQRKT